LRVRLRLLGSFHVVVDDAPVPPDAWRRDRGAALVKLLALSPGHRLHRERVMDLFWPELDAEAAGANLRKAVHFARRSLGDHDLLDVAGEVVTLAPAGGLEVDVEAFEESAKAALRSQDRAACERAADLYGGELLPDDRYVEWLEAPRKELQERYARVLRAGQLWERLVALDPTDEEAQCALMQAALDRGDRGEVIRLFKSLRDRLRIDLGVGPKASTIALYERALGGPGLAPASVQERVRASVAWGLVHLHSGNLQQAEQIAREARGLALGAELGREVGECSALLGLTAHMQGRFDQLFRAEFVEWVRTSPKLVPHVFDGHLCLIQFCMCGSDGHEPIGAAARELLAEAERVDCTGGRALAKLCMGEAALFSGRLDEAEQSLTEAEHLHEAILATAGRVMAVQRLAEIALLRGQRWRADRLIQRASSLAPDSWLFPHLQIRLHGLSVQSAATPERVEEAILEGDRALARGTTCQPCSMGFRAAAAIALAEAGELEQVSRRLDEAERLSGMWNGGPWVATLWEARGVLRRAQGSEERAVAAFGEAAARFAELRRPLDEERCRLRIQAAGARERS
jgi:DNA-binding SARP family transcriptional activator